MEEKTPYELEQRANEALDVLEGRRPFLLGPKLSAMLAGKCPNPGEADEMSPRQQTMDGYSPEDAAAYRQQVAVDVFHSLVHSIRIEVKSSEMPEATVWRVMEMHKLLMQQATEAGIIPKEEE